MLRTSAAALVAAALFGVLGLGGCGNALEPTGKDNVPAGGNNALHNDKFPCVVSQAEVAEVVGHKVAYDAVAPDEKSCNYMLAQDECPYCSLNIAVTDGVDKGQWREANSFYSPWDSGNAMRGKKVAGVGDEAFLSKLPGHEGQLEIIAGTRLVQITVSTTDELDDAGTDKLISLGKKVASRL